MRSQPTNCIKLWVMWSSHSHSPPNESKRRPWLACHLQLCAMKALYLFKLTQPSPKSSFAATGYHSVGCFLSSLLLLLWQRRSERWTAPARALAAAPVHQSMRLSNSFWMWCYIIVCAHIVLIFDYELYLHPLNCWGRCWLFILQSKNIPINEQLNEKPVKWKPAKLIKCYDIQGNITHTKGCDEWRLTVATYE